MRPSGALHKHKHIEVTPALGTEFPEANLTEMMNSPDADQFIKDLAITGEPYIGIPLSQYMSDSEDRSFQAWCRVLSKPKRHDQ